MGQRWKVGRLEDVHHYAIPFAITDSCASRVQTVLKGKKDRSSSLAGHRPRGRKKITLLKKKMVQKKKLSLWRHSQNENSSSSEEEGMERSWDDK